jgi:ABC-type branched-subunit amino acid transport system ATPase component
VVELFAFMRARLEAPVQLLSGGEQQMVAIARALLLHPELLIMDEPSTGLSPKVVRDIVGVMARLREGGMSILLVEQNVALAAQTCERAYVMSLGRIVHEVRRGEWDNLRDDERLLRAYLGGERTEGSA